MACGYLIHSQVSRGVATGSQVIVLVHGLGVSARYMLPTFKQLSCFHTVWAPELPGFGRSEKPTRALDIPELADVLAAWLASVGLGSAVFLGNSLGCQVIVDLAVRYPSVVESAILVGPTIDRFARTTLRQLLRGIRDLVHEPWSLWPILARDYFQSGPLRTLQTLQFALRDRVEEKCPLISAPTLLVRGSYDTIATECWLDELARLIPTAHAATIPGGTHAANYSVPAELARLVREFIDDPSH